MGALSHYIEAEGVATVGISLIRHHTAHLRPPRALWVPFELGRPLGVPNDSAFQRRVLEAALVLTERPSGPVLEDYPEDVPAGGDAEDGWACPIALPPPAPGDTPAEQLVRRVLDEVARLRPWYEEARRRRGRTTFGVSGLAPEAMDMIVESLARFASGEKADRPAGTAFEFPRLFRYLTDDAKSFYSEAVMARPGPTPSGQELARWLYMETVLGEMLFRVRDRLAASEDTQERRAQGGIVPGAFVRLTPRNEHG